MVYIAGEEWGDRSRRVVGPPHNETEQRLLVVHLRYIHPPWCSTLMHSGQPCWTVFSL